MATGIHLEDCTCSRDHQQMVLARITVSDDGCWTWRGNPTPTGYKRFKHAGNFWAVHRFSFEAFIGPIPDQYVVDHLCRNPECARPQHLEVVTASENLRRGAGGIAGRDIPGKTRRKRFLEPDDSRHGLPSTYRNWGCNCEPCADAERKRTGVQRRRRYFPPVRLVTTLDGQSKTLHPDDPRHGSLTGYRRWSCRCAECRAANRDAMRAYSARLRQGDGA